MKKIKKYALEIRDWLDNIPLPVLEISLWKMFEIYGTGIFKNKLMRVAAAISWSFFLSLFPFILFLLSLLPYMPHYQELQYYIFEVLMSRVFPSQMEREIQVYIQENILPNLGSIKPFTVVLAIFLATNGTMSLIEGFNDGAEKKWGIIKLYLISLAITLGFVGIIFGSLFGIYYSEVVMKLFSPPESVSWIVENTTILVGYIAFPVFYFLLLIAFYRFGSSIIQKFKYAVPGALFTTILFSLTTVSFTYYVKNFATYNLLYGSIGSILLVMVWVNLNIILILLGNELNHAFQKIRKSNEKNIPEDTQG